MNKFMLVTAISLAATSFNAHALGNMADITVFDRIQNKTLPIYKHNGHYYVAGKPGNTYQIHVQNQQSDSIEAVISVDAVNVITGKTAKASQNGYIFNGYDAYDIAGWRKSNHEIAGFYFTEIADSYAERTGRGDNVGVIGVAIYNKKPEIEYEPTQPTISRRETSERAAPVAETSSAPQGTLSKSSPAATQNQDSLAKDKRAESKKLGTGHGQIESSYVTQVEFERASTRPAEVITIYYDSYKNLLAQGVIKPQARKPMAKPFIDEANDGFVPDPS